MSAADFKIVTLTGENWFELFNAIREQEVSYTRALIDQPNDEYFVRLLELTRDAKSALMNFSRAEGMKP